MSDPAEPGVELEIQPAGKRLASMGLLSGGERSLGALAFLFALMLARPSPFYVLDEVDAALDDANISRFLELIERYRERAQFIIITHQQLTMEIADTLYGVSMAGDGVSTVLSRRAREAVAVQPAVRRSLAPWHRLDALRTTRRLVHANQHVQRRRAVRRTPSRHPHDQLTSGTEH